MLAAVNTLAGIAFDPHIRGVLVVLVAVVILCGSVYLILATNTGARLGFLLAAGGLFAWMAILSFTWWLNPPAIGPRGQNPEWQALEIIYGDPSGAGSEVAHDLPDSCFSSVSEGCTLIEDQLVTEAYLADHPELEAELKEGASLSEIAAVDPDVEGSVDLGEWELVSTADAGEAQAAADAALVDAGVFENPTQYKVLDAFETGGKDSLADDPNRWDRITYKIETMLQPRHPKHYAIMQVQAVVPVEPEPGEAPPPPEVDPDAPVISVLMIRDVGNLRFPPFMVFVGSTTMLLLIAYALHQRDKLSAEHRATAAAE